MAPKPSAPAAATSAGAPQAARGSLGALTNGPMNGAKNGAGVTVLTRPVQAMPFAQGRGGSAGGSAGAGGGGGGTAGRASRLAELDALLDGVFVAPRVIDQRAFDELAGALRSIVRDAATQAVVLESSSVEVKGLGSQLREATQALESRLDSAQRALPALEERVGRAERVLDAAKVELAARVAQIKDHALKDLSIDDATVFSLIEGRAREMARALAKQAIAEEMAQARAAMATEIQKQVDACVARVFEAASRADEAASRAEGLTQRLDAAAAREREALERVNSAVAESESTVQRLTGLGEACESRGQSMVSRVSRVVQEALEAETSLGAQAASLAERVATARTHAEDARRILDEARERADLVARGAEESARIAVERLDAAKRAADTAALAQERGRALAERTISELQAKASEVQAAADATVASAGENLRSALAAAAREVGEHDLLARLEQRVRDAKVADETLADALVAAAEHVDRTSREAMTRATADLDSRLRERADATIASAIEDAQRRADAVARTLAESVASAERQHRDAIASATRDMAERLAAMSASVDALVARAGEVERSTEAFDELRAATDVATLTAAELRELVAAGEQGEARADVVRAACEAARDEADAATCRLGDAIAHGSSRMDALCIALDHMRTEYEHLLSASQEASRMVAPVVQELTRRIELAREVIGADVRAAIDQAVAATIAPTTTRVREMGDWLTALVTQADQIGRALDRMTARHALLLAKVEGRAPGAQDGGASGVSNGGGTSAGPRGPEGKAAESARDQQRDQQRRA